MSPLRLAVVGCTGRMGRAVLTMAAGDPTFEVVAAVAAPDDPHLGARAGTLIGGVLDVPVTTEVRAPCGAVIEFTAAAACVGWARWCAAESVPFVSGTTGLTDQDMVVLRTVAERVPVVWSPNMSIGINLLLATAGGLAARLAAGWDVEITETHHRHKVDAPSGTAQALLAEICRGRGQDPGQAAVHGRQGACGPRRAGEIGMHALRMGAIVGEHEVHFTSDAESLTLRHRALSRDTFAAGALRAALWLRGRAAGWYTMRDVLGL